MMGSAWTFVPEIGVVLDSEGAQVAAVSPRNRGTIGPMVAAAPQLVEALEQQDALLVEVWELCRRRICPSGDSESLTQVGFQALVVALMDGPLRREVQEAARKALAAARPQGSEQGEGK